MNNINSGFITQMKDKNGDMWYHQVVIDTINENKDKMYQKLLLYSNELEDRIDDINNINEKISLALESAENRLDKALGYVEKNCILSDTWKDLGFCDFVPIGKIKYKALSSKKVKDLLDILKGVDKE